MARVPLQAEATRRERLADSVLTAAMRAREQRQAKYAPCVDGGFFAAAPDPKAPVRDATPAVADEIRKAIGVVGTTPCTVIDILAVDGKPTIEETTAAKALKLPLTGPQTYQILCGAEANDTTPFLLTVSARQVMARATGKTVRDWQFTPDGYFADSLRGRVYAIGRGDKLKITGIGRLKRTPSNPGFESGLWRKTLWSATFERACRFGGQGCPANDGAPAIAIDVDGPGTCTSALAAGANDMATAWRALPAGSPQAVVLASWLQQLAPDGPAVQQIAAESHLRKGDLAAAVTSFAALGDAEGLVRAAEMLAKSPKTLKDAIAAFDLALAKNARANWMVRAAGLVLQSGDKAGAKDRLHKAVEVATDPAVLKEAATLLQFLGDAQGAKAATTKAAAPK